MHTDRKQKKVVLLEMQQKKRQQPKQVDPKALEKFRAKPYQLEYAEKIRAAEMMKRE